MTVTAPAQASPKVAVAVPIGMPSPLSPLVLPQHPDEHRPEHPILLAVDQDQNVCAFDIPGSVMAEGLGSRQ